MRNVELICAWNGCQRSHPIGNQPAGWCALITYCAPQPMVVIDFRDLNFRTMRDAVLCPEHVAALESLLKDIRR